MSAFVIFTLLLAFFWGVVWALFFQFVPIGWYLLSRQTWITVCIGVGGDLLIAALIFDQDTWIKMVAIVALSSVGPIVRSLGYQFYDLRGEIDDAKSDDDSEQEARQ